MWDFHSGPVVRNLPANAGDMGSKPGPGTNIPDSVVQLSSGAITTEPTLLNKKSKSLP